MKLALLDSIKGLVKGSAGTKDLLVKAGKRHHYFDKISDLNTSITKARNVHDLFKFFMEAIIPDFEDNIELILLKKQLAQTNDASLQASILKAYESRRMDILVQRSRFPSLERSPPEIQAAYKKDQKDVFSKVPFLAQGEEDIGTYTEFSTADIADYFPKKMNGTYFEKEFIRTRRFCLFRTEEASKLIEDLRKIQPVKFLKIDYQKILEENETNNDLKEYLNDEELFPLIFQDFSITFIDCLKPHRSNPYFERVFRTAPIFDSIVNAVVRLCEEKKNLKLLGEVQNRIIVFNQIIETINLKGDRLETNLNEVGKFFKMIGNIQVKIGDNNIHIPFNKFSSSPRKLPKLMKNYRLPDYFGFNSGCLIHGDFGTGKSGVMLYLAMWAHKNDWFVVNIPSAYDLTQKYTALRRHHKTGLYMNFETADEFLKSFKISNFDLLLSTPVNKSIYGFYGTSGVHENDPDPAPNVYYKDRKTYWKDHETFLKERDRELMEAEDLELKLETLSYRLPDPHSLLEIVDAGIKSPFLAICAIYELLEQLYNLEDRCVLILADDCNSFYRPSIFKSFRYDNEKGNESGGIPPYHLSLCRAFMHFDGHMIKSGAKIMAVGFEHDRFHKFKLSDMFWPHGYSVKMGRLPLDDYRNVMEYYNQNNYLMGKCSEVENEFWWIQSDGNWKHTQDLLNDFGNLHEAGGV